MDNTKTGIGNRWAAWASALRPESYEINERLAIVCSFRKVRNCRLEHLPSRPISNSSLKFGFVTPATLRTISRCP